MSMTRDEAEKLIDELMTACNKYAFTEINGEELDKHKQAVITALTTDTEKIEACHKEIISEIETDWTWNCPVAINKSEKLKTILTKHFGGK